MPTDITVLLWYFDQKI